MRMHYVVRGGVVLAAAAAMLVSQAACGKKLSERLGEKLVEKVTEKAIEHSSGEKADIDFSKGTMTVKNKDGEVATFGNASVPDGFPTDVPIYKGSKVLTSMSTKEAMMVTLETSDSTDSVMAMYREKMLADGWTQETSMDMGGAKMLALEKAGRKTTLTVSAEGEGKATHIMIVANAAPAKSE